MTILWAGGEDIDFLPSAVAISFITTAGHFRSGYARGSIIATTNNQTLESNVFSGGELTTFWFHAQVYSTMGSSTLANNAPLIGVCKSGGWGGVVLGVKTGEATKLTAWKVTAAGVYTELGTSAGDVLTTALHAIDVQVTSLDSNPGTVKVYVDGSLVIDASSVDLTIADITGVDVVRISRYYSSSTRFAYAELSEIIISSSDTRTLSLVTHYPTATGDTDDWEGAYTDIDESAVSDVDLIYTATADEDFQANMSNVPAGSFIVPAIIVKARATKSIEGSSVGTLKLGVKSGGTIDVDAGHALTTDWATYERIAATINGGAMTTALLDAMQLDLRSAA